MCGRVSVALMITQKADTPCVTAWLEISLGTFVAEIFCWDFWTELLQLTLMTITLEYILETKDTWIQEFKIFLKLDGRIVEIKPLRMVML